MSGPGLLVDLHAGVMPGATRLMHWRTALQVICGLLECSPSWPIPLAISFYRRLLAGKAMQRLADHGYLHARHASGKDIVQRILFAPLWGNVAWQIPTFHRLRATGIP